jgi:PHS family inorganic phosphate transporter-like MFS transporter
LQRIDQAPFQIWVVVVAGIGFLTDAFGLFALNVVTPMLGYVYWPSESPDVIPSVPSSVKTAMMCSTLAATMVGQIGFGVAADFLGRRKMYGLELVIIIVGTMFLLMSSNGERNSMNVTGWLITWRAIMGMHKTSYRTTGFTASADQLKKGWA